jgi:hypothetical protein
MRGTKYLIEGKELSSPKIRRSVAITDVCGTISSSLFLMFKFCIKDIFGLWNPVVNYPFYMTVCEVDFARSLSKVDRF